MPGTEENPPVSVGGHIQWSNLPVWGKWLGGAVAAFFVAVMPVLQQWRASRAEEAARVAEIKAAKVAERAKEAQGTGTQAKSAAESGYQVSRPWIENLDRRLSALEAAQARAARKAGARRSQIPAPQKPKPLPPDLNAAERLVVGKVAAAPPTAPPAQPHPLDAGQ